MIKLFKNIRKKLATENKALGYMRYAIGEIVLVVIGILIALQINNWNNHKNEYNQLQKDLLTIKENLHSDDKSISNHIAQGHNLIAYWGEILNQKDSVQYEYFINTLMGPGMQVGNTGYVSALNNNSLNLVKNDSLKQNIIGYYEEDFQKIKSMESKMYDVGITIREKIMTETFSSKTPEEFSRAIKQMFQHEVFKRIFRDYYQAAEYLTQLYNKRKKLLTKIIYEIDKETIQN